MFKGACLQKPMAIEEYSSFHYGSLKTGKTIPAASTLNKAIH